MPLVGFEPTISAGERPQTYALDRADIEIGSSSRRSVNFILLLKSLAVDLYFEWQSDWKMSSFVSTSSMKNRRRRRRSGQIATKTKTKQAAARTTNTIVITIQKNTTHLLRAPNLPDKYVTETC